MTERRNIKLYKERSSSLEGGFQLQMKSTRGWRRPGRGENHQSFNGDMGLRNVSDVENVHQAQQQQQLQQHAANVAELSPPGSLPPPPFTSTKSQDQDEKPPSSRLSSSDDRMIKDLPSARAPHGHHNRSALADTTTDHHHHHRLKESHQVRERIDDLLADDLYRSPTGETALDFIKHTSPQVKTTGERHEYDPATRHHHRRHHRNHRSHSNRSRPKRNNLGEGHLDLGPRPVVATNKGLVRGISQKIFNDKFVDAFLGVPFAQPPTGAYRFRHPQPVSPWQGEFDASQMSNSCYQVNDTFFGQSFMGTSIWNANTPLDEDCLYLNIWTPFGVANATIPSPRGGQRRSSDSHKTSNPNPFGGGAKLAKRPVLVWIFGGGFYSGSSTLKLYEGGALASEEDIIVVSMNYRVSSLGFLYLGRPDAPGNAGLFDQLLALQWINDNIDQFGGDPERVTIFGESAGAVSVAFHLLSPLSRNLFSQAILQSGAATCPWGSMDTKESIANGLQLASLLNCPSNQNDLDTVIKCLLKVDPMALVSQEVGQTRSVLNFPFVPVVDGSFLLEPPAESLAKANFKSARVLLGSNNDEANAFLIYLPEFSNCPANGNAPAEQTTSKVPPVNEAAATALKSASDDQDHIATENGDPSVAGGETEGVELFTFGRDRKSGASTVKDNTTTSHHQQQQQQTNSIQSSTKTNQKQQQQVNELNADSSKPCRPNEYLSLTREDFHSILREDLNPFAGHNIGKKAIVFEYSNWNNPLDPVSHYDAIDKIVGDYYFTCHVNEFAHQYAQAGNAVFMYYFKHRSSISPWPKWMGVLHADEINFVFGEPLNPSYNYTQKEVELSRRMMRYWANFARFGNPTPKNEDSNSSVSERWPEYKDKRQYFELNSDYLRVGRGPRAKQCAFWSQYLPQLIQSYDNNNQCQVPVGEPTLSSHLYPQSSSQTGKYVYPRLPRNFLPITSTASAILFSFIFIIIIVGLVSTYIIYTKGFTWKFDLWPGTGATGGRSADDDDDEETERNGTTNRNGQSRGGRWRNQRAAASRKRTNAAAAAAATAAAAAGDGSSSVALPATPNQNVTSTPAATSSTLTTGLSTNQKLTTSINIMHQQQQPSISSMGQASRLSSMQMQNLRSPVPSVSANSGSGGPALIRQQQTTVWEQQAPTNGEQSAFELAQTAAARVTASGSAAAAMAAAKFKMLRSNTLAAAFGRNVDASDQSASVSVTANSAATKIGGQGAQTHSAAADLIASRTKDERVVNTLSSPAIRSRRPEFN